MAGWRPSTVSSIFFISAVAGILSPALTLSLSFVGGTAIMLTSRGNDMAGVPFAIGAVLLGPAVVAAVAGTLVSRNMDQVSLRSRVIAVALITAIFLASCLMLAPLVAPLLAGSVDYWWVVSIGGPVIGGLITLAVGVMVRGVLSRR